MSPTRARPSSARRWKAYRRKRSSPGVANNSGKPCKQHVVPSLPRLTQRNKNRIRSSWRHDPIFITPGSVYLWKKQYDQAIAEAERAIALDFNFADAYTLLGETLKFA